MKNNKKLRNGKNSSRLRAGFFVSFLCLVFLVALGYVIVSFLETNRNEASAAFVFGNDSVGTNIYPDGGMKKLGELTLTKDDGTPRVSAIDTINNYGYLGNIINLAGGSNSIVRLDLSVSPPKRVQAIFLPDNLSPSGAVVDEVNGYAYFGLGYPGQTPKIVKVDINPSRTFKIVGEVLLDPVLEQGPRGAVIDPAGGYAYFFSSTTPGRLIKIDLITLAKTSLGLTSACEVGVIDPLPGGTGYLYCSSSGASQTNIFRVNLATFTFAGAGDTLILPGEIFYRAVVLDPGTTFAYWGTATSPARIVQVNLAAFALGAVSYTLPVGQNLIQTAAIDGVSHYAYFGLASSQIVELNLSVPSPYVLTSFPDTISNRVSSIVNPVSKKLYFGLGVVPGVIQEVNITHPNVVPMGTTTLSDIVSNLQSAVIDPANNVAYFAASTAPGKIAKVDLNTFSLTSVLTLEPGDDNIYASLIDRQNQKAYFSSNVPAAGQIFKIDLASFSKEAEISPLLVAPAAGIIDLPPPAGNGLAYFVSRSSPGSVYKINLSTFTNVLPPIVTTGIGNNNTAVIDTTIPANPYGYLGNDQGDFIKLNLLPGGQSFVGALPIIAGETGFLTSVIDQSAGFAYLGTGMNLVSQKIVKINLRDTGAPLGMSRVGSIDLVDLGQQLTTSIIDPARKFSYWGSNASTPYIYRVNLNNAIAPFGFSLAGKLSLPVTNSYLRSSVLDSANNISYWGTNTDAPNPAKVIKINNSTRGYIYGFKAVALAEIPEIHAFDFYSHAASGNVRLALLYDNPLGSNKELVWESGVVPNTVANGWLRVMVSSGTPATLIDLPAGNYWLAWQTDSADIIGSQSIGTAGDGFYLAQGFGAFPGTIAGETVTDERWSMFALTIPVPPSGPIGGITVPSPLVPPSNLKGVATSTSSISWQFTDMSTDEDGYKLYETVDGGPATFVSEVAQNNLSQITEGDLTPNNQYARYVTTYNYEGESDLSNIAYCYTLANQPLPPIVTDYTADGVVLAINPDDGNPSYTEYAIYDTLSGQYVQADGSLGPDPVWQTYEQWGGVSGIIVLTPGDGFYDFSTIARNGDDVETAYSESVTVPGSGAAPETIALTASKLSCLSYTAASINWQFTDPNGNESGVRLYEPLAATAPKKISEVQQSNSTEIVEKSLVVNKQYTRVVASYNADGESPLSNVSSCYTLANQPLQPIIKEYTGEYIILAINPNDKNPSYTQYAILENFSKQYVQSDGSFGPEPVWQTYEQWGGAAGIKITGEKSGVTAQFHMALNPDKDYTFSVKARNGDVKETVLSIPAAVGPESELAPAPEEVTGEEGAPGEEGVPGEGATGAGEEGAGGAGTGGTGTGGAGTGGAGTGGAVGQITGQKPGLPTTVQAERKGMFESALNYLKTNFLDNKFWENFFLYFVTPLLATIALLNTLPTALTLVSYWLIWLHLLFTEPLLYLFKKQREKWGVVYDSLSKVPVDLAIVRLYSKKDKKLIQTRITDKNGRYLLNAREEGLYYLTVEKPGFIFPTRYLKGDKDDIKYLDLYHGEMVEVRKNNTTVSVNIPVDSAEKKALPASLVIKHYLRENFRLMVSYLGIILALIVVIVIPTVVTVAALILHLILYLIFRRLIVPPKPKSWGIIYDKKDKKPLAQSVIRIFDLKFNKLLETQVADRKGRYAFLVGKNKFQVSADKNGYQQERVSPVDLVKEKEIIALNIGLKKLGSK